MLNHITIMGRLTRDPELRRTGSGTPVASFTVACDRDFGGQDGQKEVDFIDCVAWRQTGEFVEKFFTKGRMIVVDGRLQIRKYTDKNGNNRTAAEVVADHCYFGDSKRDDGGSQGGFGGNTYGGGSYGGNQGGFGGNSYGQQSGGYGGGYAAPGNFAMMDDDDAQIPF